MKNIKIGSSNYSSVAMGCMRLQQAKDPQAVIEAAYQSGITFFDHADIYGGGQCERIFGEALQSSYIKREDIFIQSKCSIVSGQRYDMSKEHILKSVDEILERLNTNYLDSLLLHRPDPLMDPCEVADAIDELFKAGKIRYFGVSNMGIYQIELLQKYLKQPITFNQLQYSIMHTNIIDSGININMPNNNGDGLYEYCRLNNIIIQAWSPFQYGFFEGTFIDNSKFPELNDLLATLADKYQTTKTGIATAWILRTPNLQMISGSMNITRINDIVKASEICLTRQDWYDIYKAAGNQLP